MNLRKEGDYFHVQMVRCCLTQHPIFVLNSNPSAHLVEYCKFKKNSCDLKKSDSQYPN